MSKKQARPAATATDTHLKVERGKTDEELSARAAIVEQEAGHVIDVARTQARQVVVAARRAANEKVRGGSEAALRTLTEERAREDEALRQQYGQADETAALERRERKQLLSELLGSERTATDKSLLIERADAEDLVTKRDDFLGMVSHDLRNELGGIALSAARLAMNADQDGAGQKLFRTATNIQRITLRMSRLIGDLLDVASIEAGKFTVIAEEEDVSRLMLEMVDSFQGIAAAKDIHLEAKTVGGPLRALYDHQRILQVLANLLTNALKFSAPGTRVSVCAERKPDHVCISVQDAGSGIPEDRLKTIFERFSQGGGSDRRGLGLGLYIAQRIVEAHHGRIWAVSALGTGTTFYFTLPLVGST